MRLLRFTLVASLFVFSLLPCLFASWPLSPQHPPADAAEISRDLLFLAPTRVEIGPSRDMPETLLIGKSFTYQYIERRGWAVLPAESPRQDSESLRKAPRTVELAGATFTLTPDSDDDRATLALAPAGASEPLVTAVVWTRDELADAWLPFLQRRQKSLTRAALQKDLEVADPIITTAQRQGVSTIWVALAHSVGENELGLGTVVRFSPGTKQGKVFHPSSLALCDVSHLDIFGHDIVLLGTRIRHEGTIQPCAGLVSLRVADGQAQSITLSRSLPALGIVTALGDTDRVWVSTDSAICGGAPEGSWTCQRIVPSVTLKSAATVFNKPGEKSGSELKPGEYEVLWANQNFLEIVTKDSYDAWLAADDFAEAAARNFDTEPYKLLNTSTGISSIRPLAKPGGEPLEGTLLYRAPLEKLAAPQGTPAGWVKVRIHAGWIERGKLEVVPKLVPLSEK